MNYLITFFLGYIIGSLPTAYLLLRITHNIDITKTGSGNVGAMNSYEVSNSKWIGILVFLIDAIKGLLSCFMAFHFIGNEFIYPMLALIASVFSHCYSPWLKFKGGRGLATSAGGGVFISLPVIAIWGLTWLPVFIFKRNVHIGNIAATVVTGILPFIAGDLMMKLSFLVPKNSFEFSISISSLMLIILSKHISPLIDYIKNLKTNEV
jgi:acyl phosphate:glycerol-3-phosphate acyltransferase